MRPGTPGGGPTRVPPPVPAGPSRSPVLPEEAPSFRAGRNPAPRVAGRWAPNRRAVRCRIPPVPWMSYLPVRSSAMEMQAKAGEGAGHARYTYRLRLSNTARRSLLKEWGAAGGCEPVRRRLQGGARGRREVRTENQARTPPFREDLCLHRVRGRVPQGQEIRACDAGPGGLGPGRCRGRKSARAAGPGGCLSRESPRTPWRLEFPRPSGRGAVNPPALRPGAAPEPPCPSCRSR